MREWKPGDVALVEAGCWANRKVALRLAEGWSHVNGVNVDGDGIVTSVRPLVVIDPEDREQVERLHLAYATTVSADRVAGMQAALREFADPKPPKPDEPTGLGAVVEDRWGHRYIRMDMCRATEAHSWHNAGEDSRCTWAHIDAVKVLSEGVTS